MSDLTTVDTRRWYAVRTKLRNEDRVDSNLIAWGIETFAPRIKKWRRNQFTGRPINLSQSLFPGYIFARFDAGLMLHKICYTRGVQSVVSFNGEPLPVDDEIIALIQSQVGEDGFVRIGEDLRPGDEVMIRDGSLKGIQGIFHQSINDTGRVRILLTAINYQASLIIEKEVVRKNDQSVSLT